MASHGISHQIDRRLSGIFVVPSRQVVPPARGARYTPRRAEPNLSLHDFSCPALAASLQGAPGATPGTRPLATPPLGRRPQEAWSVHCTTRRLRTAVGAPSIKRISLRDPGGPLRSRLPQASSPQHHGPFLPRPCTLGSRQPQETQRQPLPLPWIPTACI